MNKFKLAAHKNDLDQYIDQVLEIQSQDNLANLCYGRRRRVFLALQSSLQHALKAISDLKFGYFDYNRLDNR